jgi:hypothetical protein
MIAVKQAKTWYFGKKTKTQYDGLENPAASYR